MENTEKTTQEKVILNEKTYTVRLIHFSDGSVQLRRTNDGFNAIELLGILNLTSHENVDYLTGKVELNIDEIKREVVKD